MNQNICRACKCSVMSDSLWPHGLQPPRLFLSMKISRQEYLSGCYFLLLGDLPDLGIKPVSSATPALQADSLLLSHWWSSRINQNICKSLFKVLWRALGVESWALQCAGGPQGHKVLCSVDMVKIQICLLASLTVFPWVNSKICYKKRQTSHLEFKIWFHLHQNSLPT